MCYVLKFKLMILIKACKFTAFPRTFQIINYLFFKEVCKHNVYSVLRIKKVFGFCRLPNHRNMIVSNAICMQYFHYFCSVKSKKTLL